MNGRTEGNPATASAHLVWLTVNCSYSHSSLALPLIHAACRDVAGWTWERMEVIREEDSARIAAKITATHCDLLCATLYLFNREKVLDILQRVHALSPETHIAVGGPECPACDAENILESYPFISTVFSGEGEGVFPDFLREFPQKKGLRRAIPSGGNACYEDWADAPCPVEDEFFRTDKPFVQIETSRGCPMACAYCTSSGVKTRFRDLDRVKHELELLQARGVREIRVLDRTFNLPQERGAALLRLFALFPEMHFHLEIHPQFLGAELRDCLQKARPGQLHIEAGLQSLDPAVQASIGRKSDVGRALDGLRFLTSCTAFETHTDLLAGLPAQTLDSLKSDLAELMQAAPGEIQLEVLKILPGTPVKKVLNQFGICFSPAPPYDVMRTDTMSAEDILTARELSRLLDLFYNHRAMHPVMLAAAEERRNIFLSFAAQVHQEQKDLNTFMDLRKRFLYLLEFLKKEVLPQALDQLAYQWLMTGFPAGEGPVTNAEAVHALPDGMTLIHGIGACLADRDTKYRILRCLDRTYCFAYNRRFACNTPCAVWQAVSTPQ